MKVTELSGDELNDAVARAHGMIRMAGPKGVECWGYPGRKHVQCRVSAFLPSTLWAWGGPIIQRERITLEPREDHWIATLDQGIPHFGIDPLMAAMRAYVASKYGDEVTDD